MCAPIETTIPECKISNHDWRLIFSICLNVSPSKINEEIIKNKEFMINEKSFIKEASQKNQYIVVFVGKKKFGVVELVT